MRRRSFLKGAAALFAAIAGTGPTLLEDRGHVRWIRHDEADILRGAAELQRGGRWRAERKLRIANHMIETATGATRLLAKGTDPVLMVAFIAEMKARLADIQREAPPWIRRRSVMMAQPEVT